MNAIPKNKYYLVAGGSITVTTNDFNYFDDNNNPISVPSGAYDIEITAKQRVSVVTDAGSMTITAYKHLNSTTDANDVNNVTPNTYKEDSARSTFSVTGNIDVDGDLYNFTVDGIYFAALYPPNISASRLYSLIGVSGSHTYSNIFTSTNINKYSLKKSDKQEPHNASEFIGYSHSLEGNIMAITDTQSAIVNRQGIGILFDVYKMPVIDDNINLNSIRLTLIPVGGGTSYNSDTYNLSSITYKEGIVNITNNNTLMSDDVRSYTPTVYTYYKNTWEVIKQYNSIRLTFKGVDIIINSITPSFTSNNSTVNLLDINLTSKDNYSNVKVEGYAEWVNDTDSSTGRVPLTGYKLFTSSATLVTDSNNLSFSNAFDSGNINRQIISITIRITINTNEYFYSWTQS